MSNRGQAVSDQVSIPLIGDGVLPPKPPPTPSVNAIPELSEADIGSMSPRQLQGYLTALIAHEWQKSATYLYPSRDKVVANLMLSDKELAVYHVKFRCEDVPQSVVAQVRYLAELTEKGEGCFDNLMVLLKEEMRLVTFQAVSGAVAMVNTTFFLSSSCLGSFVMRRLVFPPLSRFSRHLPVMSRRSSNFKLTVDFLL